LHKITVWRLCHAWVKPVLCDNLKSNLSYVTSLSQTCLMWQAQVKPVLCDKLKSNLSYVTSSSQTCLVWQINTTLITIMLERWLFNAS
jgi:hypothetical protein